MAIKVVHGLDARPDLDVILAIGSFDGVHLGHQRLLGELVDCAQRTGRLSAVLTFSPHPREVLQPELEPAYLSSPEERLKILESLGLDFLVLLPFTRELADTSAEDFVRQLHDKIRMCELWVGPGFVMGRGQEGDIARLQELAAQVGYVLRVFPPVLAGGQVISSTRIRSLLKEGRVREVQELLGRPYALSAQVSRGAQRGRHLGFRTANMMVDPTRAMPAYGVYAVWFWVDGQRFAGVANIGVRPSFGEEERVLEVHLLDYDGDLYGKDARVEFVQRLRPEMRFERIPSLVEQVQRDIALARKILISEKGEKRVGVSEGLDAEIPVRSAADKE
ncbi:MAG: riboflavin biosynthesis protein RibF [Chloroflexi bacterium RBG_13_56_8]|nr:MAG: riboflavin biosynthesis protein RibF [Chloroflexi bacterium RBG_13_56_8]